MVARYILLKLKTLNSRNFKCVSHPFVFYITAITTDNVKCFELSVFNLSKIYLATIKLKTNKE